MLAGASRKVPGLLAGARWLRIGVCCLGWIVSAAAVAAETPTARELLAAQDKDLESQLAGWGREAFALPDDLALDEPLQRAATQLAQEHLARLQSLWPAWIAQERAASSDPYLRGKSLSRPIYSRAINELAIWSIEGGGPEHEAAWLRAALAPTACKRVFSSHFARHMTMIQEAPPDIRPALLEAERSSLARWGTTRTALPTRPADDEAEAADRAISLLRAGVPVTAEPMTANLAGQLFNRKRKPGPSSRWEQCAKSQWWLASQLAQASVDRTAALNTYRFSTMVRAEDFAPTTIVQRTPVERPIEKGPDYPPVASYFGAEGTTTVRADIDAQGKALKARVVERKISVPGVRGNPPVAFDTLLDAAALAYAEKRSYPVGEARTVRFAIGWRLEESKDEPR